MKNWNMFLEGYKTLLEKEKMLATNMFSFSKYVFKGSFNPLPDDKF